MHEKKWQLSVSDEGPTRSHSHQLKGIGGFWASEHLLTVKCFHEGAQKAKEKAGDGSFYHQAPFPTASLRCAFVILISSCEFTQQVHWLCKKDALLNNRKALYPLICVILSPPPLLNPRASNLNSPVKSSRQIKVRVLEDGWGRKQESSSRRHFL